MIYVKLHGRIGNHLFQIAAAASLANENNDNFVAICHTDYLLSEPDNCSIWEYTRKFSKNIYRNFEILEHAPINLTEKKYINFSYTPILYENKILLNGAFQSYKYIDKKITQRIFQPPYLIEKSIFSKIGHVLRTKPVSVLVRRGDYLLIPHKFPVVSKKYIKKSMGYFGKERNFLFISDDIEWCKKKFSGENYFFLDSSDVLTDLYAQSFCHDNIISNSTFGWWGAFLNKNKKKNYLSNSLVWKI